MVLTRGIEVVSTDEREEEDVLRVLVLEDKKVVPHPLHRLLPVVGDFGLEAICQV